MGEETQSPHFKKKDEKALTWSFWLPPLLLRLTASGLGSITPMCAKPVSKNRKRLESGSHGDIPIIS
jgi:hypothetical protein